MAEQRRDPRNAAYEDVFLELVAEGAAGDMVQKVVSCKVVDFSVSGVKLFVDYPIPVGTIVNMCVVMAGAERRFNLITELRWIRDASDPGWFFAGFEIYEGEMTDCDAWYQFTRQFHGE
ncbi:Hypothetical protein HDN1F_33670 [gamma proteobacterium HdN1]|nr:Hypothetical protein HDN1F_33670 [gamma proteobacterium HdN1]